MDAKFENPDGSTTERRFIPTLPEFRVEVDGKETPAGDLAVGQHIWAYVPVEPPPAPVVYTPPPSPPPPPVAKTQPYVAQAEMPETASALPLLALIGAGLICLAAALRRLKARM